MRTKHDDDDGGEQEPNDTAGDVREDDGNGAVDAHVAKEERAQQQIATRPYYRKDVYVEHSSTKQQNFPRTGHDAGGIAALVLRAGLRNDFECHGVEGQQAKGEAAKEGREGDQACRYEDGRPGGEGDVWLHAVMLEQRVAALEAV